MAGGDFSREAVERTMDRHLSAPLVGHLRRTAKTAEEMGGSLGENRDHCWLAGMTHDYAKEMNDEVLLEHSRRFDVDVNWITRLAPGPLLHGPVGAKLLKQEGLVTDERIARAIACHTTGREEMTLLDKILFLADKVEPGRRYDGVERVRSLVDELALDRAVLVSLDGTIRSLISRSVPVHPRTLAARNAFWRRVYADRS